MSVLGAPSSGGLALAGGGAAAAAAAAGGHDASLRSLEVLVCGDSAASARLVRPLMYEAPCLRRSWLWQGSKKKRRFFVLHRSVGGVGWLEAHDIEARPAAIPCPGLC